MFPFHCNTVGSCIGHLVVPHPLCPYSGKDHFLENLAAEIQQWQDAGIHIILMTDMNEDILAPRIKTFVRKHN